VLAYVEAKQTQDKQISRRDALQSGWWYFF